jgi:hypothetical protein
MCLHLRAWFRLANEAVERQFELCGALLEHLGIAQVTKTQMSIFH